MQKDLFKLLSANTIVKGSNVLIAFAMSVVLARFMGAENYGIYSYVLALLGMVFLPVTTGLSNLVVREVSIARAAKNYVSLSSLLVWSQKFTLTFVLITIVLAFGAYVLLNTFISPVWKDTLLLGSLVMSCLLIEALVASVIRAFGFVVSAQIPGQILRPAIHILLILFSVCFGSRNQLTPTMIMGFYLVSALATIAITRFIKKVKVDALIRTVDSSGSNGRRWLRQFIPLSLVAGLGAVNGQADLLILGLYMDGKSLGVYRVALQVAFFLSVGLVIANATIAPHISKLYNEGNIEELQEMISKVSRVLVVSALPASLVCIVFPTLILESVFGGEFLLGQIPLQILASAQLINTMAGSVGIILLMTGNEDVVRFFLLISIVINVSFSFLLIPQFGMVGAAIANFFSIAFANIYMWKSVQGKVGINTMQGLWSR